MSKSLKQTLLDAHVKHILTRVDSKHLDAEAEKLVDQLLPFANDIKLGDIVDKKDITDTAIFFATEMDIGPGIPEIVAEISRDLYQNKAHDKAILNDLLSDEDFHEVLDKIAEMDDARERIIHEIVGNPTYTALVSDLLYNGISRYLQENPLTKRIPGARSMVKFGKGMMDKAGLQKYISHNAHSAMKESERFLNKQLSREHIIDNASKVWEKIKKEDVSQFRDYVAEDDVEEFFVIGLEFWKHFRETDYCKALISSAVEFFFKKYGKTTLGKLLDELGVTRDMIVTEAKRYAPGIVAELNKHGFIEELARTQLADFYDSEAVAKLLDGK